MRTLARRLGALEHAVAALGVMDGLCPACAPPTDLPAVFVVASERAELPRCPVCGVVTNAEGQQARGPLICVVLPVEAADPGANGRSP